MRQNAAIAFRALKKLNAPVINHGDPNNQWGAHFILSAEHRHDGRLFADTYHEEIREHRNDAGEIVNAFGIRQDVIEILDTNNLFAEWIDAGTVGIYDS